MEICAKTHQGMVRELNEDSYAVSELTPYHLLIVADGMGGHQAGEVASAMAVEKIREYISRHTEESIPQLLEQALHYANEQIYIRSKENASYAAMGTTVVLCCISDKEAYFANVGDSRAYLLGLDGMEQITEDHSLVMELLRQGEITEEEAELHPQRNVITRALGTERITEVDLFHCELTSEDMVLLCSDGLTGMLSDQEIASVMWEASSLEERVDQLIELANERGGYDNITIIAATQKKEG
ncbi:MAG: Stp1/IreP family PP2C-type Ser/Thr phosphatase [Ruminococcaceae bacterium]|nr:Stp1/IreP family PP2C-type Ser/Thr phosphatase [Oscillospiraceae bacterium]